MKRRAFFASLFLPFILLLKRRDPLCVGYIQKDPPVNGWTSCHPVFFPGALERVQADPQRDWYFYDPRRG